VDKDRNGRTLGRVWCGGIDANAEQVRRGMAWVFDRYVRDRSLYPLQDAARSARRGGVGRRRAGSTLGMAISERRA
jgi:endonuclease YncB( thermonuclease family)